MSDTCPYCDTPIDAADRFCGECGATLAPPKSGNGDSRRVDQYDAHRNISAGFQRLVLDPGRDAALAVLPLFEAAIGAAPDMPEPHLGKATCLAHLGDFDQALLSVDTAFQLGLGQPGRPVVCVPIDQPDLGDEIAEFEVDVVWACLVRADILLALDRPREALEQIDRLFEIGVPGQYLVEVDAILTIALVEVGDLVEAEKALSEAEEWDAAAARVAEARGRLRQAQGRLEEAVQAFSAAVAAEPDDPDYLVLRACALNEANRKGEARADLEEALRILLASQASKSEIAEVHRQLAAL